ncbi:non-hydrolyzing UDP-N-acetylglucosamine 2-epimerase [Pedococcus sp. P5_B7]
MLGTRPEIIKLAPVIRQLRDVALVVHTGQHYDESMSGVFLAEHGLDSPDVHLDAGGLGRAEQLSVMLLGLDRALAGRELSAVVVQGDTNSTLAGALTANALSVPLVHVEAGLRSYDRAMPEEHNRVMVDHLADALCAATTDNVANLRREGIPDHRIHLTGNTVVEAVIDQLGEPRETLEIVETLGLQPNSYVLATIHRPENTDDPAVLRTILTELAQLPCRVVLPLHPRTQAAARRAGAERELGALGVIAPVGSRQFLALAAHAAVLVSDSGGVQEECTVLKRPLVVVRRSTERPEALADFAVLVRPGPDIGAAVRARWGDLDGWLDRLAGLPSPFGDAGSAKRVVEVIRLSTQQGTSHLAPSLTSA